MLEGRCKMALMVQGSGLMVQGSKIKQRIKTL
jgi:hypothetical protein